MGQSTPIIKKKTVLIVEDDLLERCGLVDFFDEHEWLCYEASNAEEAMALLDRHEEIQVVLTDVHIRGEMDGLKLAAYIRERFPPTMLFVMSGRAVLTPDTLPVRTTFLQKPFDPYRMLRQIEQASVG